MNHAPYTYSLDGTAKKHQRLLYSERLSYFTEYKPSTYDDILGIYERSNQLIVTMTTRTELDRCISTATYRRAQ